MKNYRFLWLRNSTTDNRKCEKARNIKEKRTIEMLNTVSKQLVALRSSASDNRLLRLYQKVYKTPENQGFPGFSYTKTYLYNLTLFHAERTECQMLCGRKNLSMERCYDQ